MNHAQALLPAPLGRLLSRLPAYPGSLLFVAVLNLAMLRHLPPDVRQALAGKRLRISVLDAQLGFNFVWARGRFSAYQEAQPADLTIAASANDFMLLAQRREDPDTLFFSRRLILEGDTELGLLIKNTLDTIEMPLFRLRALLPEWARKAAE